MECTYVYSVVGTLYIFCCQWWRWRWW